MENFSASNASKGWKDQTMCNDVWMRVMLFLLHEL